MAGRAGGRAWLVRLRPSGKISSAIGALLLGIGGPASAAPESAFFESLPLTTAVSSLPQTALGAPAAITVIDREMIRALGPVSLAEIMRLVPGFLVSAARSNLAVVAHHGLADDRNRRFLLLIDGRSAYSPYIIGGVEWNLIPVSADDIERIEVVRGSNAPLFGSNALLGVANIVTRHAGEQPGAQATLAAGSGHAVHASAAYAWAGEADFLRLRAETMRDEGFEPELHGRRTTHASVRFDRTLSPQDAFEIHAGSARSDEDTGSIADTTQPPNSYLSTLDFVLGRWHHSAGLEHQTTITAYHHREGADLVVPASSPFLPGVVANLDYSYHVDRTDIEIQHRYTHTPETRCTAGAAIRWDDFSFPIALARPDDGQTMVSRVHAHIEHDLGARITLHGGALAEAQKDGPTRVSPRLSLNFQPGANSSLRLSALQAWRLPNPYERASDERAIIDGRLVGLVGPVVAVHRSIPNPSLRPERLQSYELGYVARLADNRLLLEGKLQRELISDTIISVAVDNPAQLLPPFGPKTSAQFRNRADLRIDSIEAVATWRPTIDNWLSGWVTLLDAESAEAELARSVPALISGISAAAHAGGWRLGLLYSHSSSMRWLRATSDEPTQDYLALSARRTIGRMSGHEPVEVGIEVRRALGERSAFTADNPLDPTVMLRLRVGGV